jgi:lipopolysaccharide/colanic/teichoic acid biosynthesis glycosyltransferase
VISAADQAGIEGQGLLGNMGRLVEFVVVFAGAVIIFPLFLCVYILIRSALGRPVFFVQTRVGRGGVPFRLIKFRTMSTASGPDGQPLSDDLRVTPLTRLVRRLRLDEIPQVWLILRGDMALVGPRPLLPATIAGFGAAGIERCRVRPGLTGWAQVSGNTALTDTEKLSLDLWYVANRSLALDVRILLETVRVAVLGEVRRPERLAEALRFTSREVADDGYSRGSA